VFGDLECDSEVRRRTDDLVRLAGVRAPRGVLIRVAQKLPGRSQVASALRYEGGGRASKRVRGEDLMRETGHGEGLPQFRVGSEVAEGAADVARGDELPVRTSVDGGPWARGCRPSGWRELH